MVTRILNPAATIKAIESIMVDSLEAIVPELDTAFTQALSDRVYSGFGRTRRKNGEVVTNPRNAIDEGELDSSQRLLRESRVVWRWDWLADHALIVHEGATLRGGGVYPARRWTGRAVLQYKPYVKFAREVRSRV